MRSSRTATLVTSALAIAFLAAAIVLTILMPAESVLGGRVRLPMFHGASTWVAMMLFSLMGIAALLFLLTKRDTLSYWEAGLRTVAGPLWVFNSAAGLYAALQTWDFTGSSRSPIAVAMQDPRLVAQFWLLLAVGILMGLDVTLDKAQHKAFADLGFTALAAWLLGNVLLDPVKRSLHPDNPVLNSGWDVKSRFFGIVACLLVSGLLAAWLVARRAAAHALAGEPAGE
jgi:hypothetical protein